MEQFLKNNDSQDFNNWHAQNCQSKIAMQDLELSHLFITQFNLVNADFSDMTITDCYFKNVNFWASNFTNTKFINCHFVSCCFGTPELIDASASILMQFVFTTPIFKDTKFIKGKFLNVTFRENNLSNSLFMYSSIEKCNFRSSFIEDIENIETNWLNNIS
jgi:uncharacterized protein YjbI with pentapeptide repeats